MIISKLLNRLRGGPSCDEIMEVLQSYLDGEVDVETARKVSSHLDMCTDCGHESEVYRSIKTSLSNSAQPVDPEVLASLQAFSARLVAGEIE